MGVMLDACPSFTPTWQSFLDQWRGEDDLPLYVVLGDLARHLIGLAERGESAELPAAFRVVERWHLEGDEYVRTAATVGLLEGLQNYNLHTGATDPAQFRAMLGLESARRWDDLAASWNEFFQAQEAQQQGQAEPRAAPDRGGGDVQ